MDLQVRVFDVERQLQPFPMDGARKRSCDVEIQRVAELVQLSRSTGLNAGRHVARIMASKTRFAERSQQITESLVAEEVEALVSDLEFGSLLSVAGLSASARRLGAIRRLVYRNVVFLLHPLDKLFDQFIQRAVHLH